MNNNGNFSREVLRAREHTLKKFFISRDNAYDLQVGSPKTTIINFNKIL